MKKTLCIVLSTLMLVSCCACLAGCGEDDVRGNISVTPTLGDITTEPTTQPTLETPDDDEPIATEPAFSLGATSGSIYSNEFLGMTFALPEGWEFFTEKQILEMNNIVSDYMGEEVAEQLANANIIYDMYAQQPDNGSSVTVLLEKFNALQLLNLDKKEYIEAQIPTVENTYANMGYTDVTAQYQTVTIDGQELDGMCITAAIGDFTFTSISFIFQKGNYLANVSVGSLQADVVAAALDSFTLQ